LVLPSANWYFGCQLLLQMPIVTSNAVVTLNAD
jgi:hypothetical protein